MKKFIMFFTGCISLFIFYFVFQLCSQQEFINVSGPRSIQEFTGYHRYAYDMDFMEDIDGAIKKLQAYAKAYHGVIYIGSTVESDTVFNTNAKFYEDPYHELDGMLVTKNHQKFYFDDTMQGYISSKEDKHAIDVIDFMDRRNQASYQDTIQYYPMHMFSTLAKDMNKNLVYIFTQLDEVMQAQSIEDSGLTEYVINDISSDLKNVGETKELVFMLQVLCICGIAVLLLYSCEMYKSRKELMIRKLMGQSCVFIAKDMFFKQFVVYTMIYMIVQSICYMLWVGSIRSVTYPLILQLLYCFLLYIIIQCIVYICMYMYIRKSKNVVYIKQKESKNKMTYVNIVVKILVVTIFLPSLITHVVDGKHMMDEYLYMIQHEKELRNQLYVETINFNMGDGLMGMDKAMKEVNAYMKDHGAIYQDFDESFVWQEIAKEDPESKRTPYIIVNKAYLKPYHIKDLSGNEVDLNTIDKVTLFQPEGVEILQDAFTYCNEECEVITIQSGTRYWDTFLNSYTRSLKDPLIVYRPVVSADMSGSNGHHLVLTDESVEKEFQSFLDEKGLTQMITYQKTTDDYDHLVESYKDKVLYTIPLLIVYVCVMLVFIYQIVYMYFEQHKQRFVLQYMLGDHFFHRHGKILYWSILSYAVIMISVYQLSELSIQNIMTTIFIMLVFEFIAQFELIHRIEKQKMVEIMKGE